MIRLHVICEGQTEEMFVNEVLAAYLGRQMDLRASRVGKPGRKGGDVRFSRLLHDVRQRLLGDRSAYCTTFFDFYGLPPKFPGRSAARRKRNHWEKGACVVQAMTVELQNQMGDEPMRRFIPYVQMYEFEGLLFSDPDGLSEGINARALANRFREIREAFATPEEINDDPRTAPSRRIQGLFPEYEKPLHGTLAAIEIGLGKIRQQCPLFDSWVRRLQSLIERDSG